VEADYLSETPWSLYKPIHGVLQLLLISLCHISISVFKMCLNSFYSVEEYLDRDNKFEPGVPQ
jgi:hypothetical protein